MSAHAVTAEHRPAQAGREGFIQEPLKDPSPPAGAPRRPGATPAATLALAGVLCFATFLAGGGLNLASMTTLELTFTLVSGVVVAGAVALAPAGTRLRGLWPVRLLLAFTALTGLSVVWSVAPDASWQDAGRMLAYSAIFAAAAAAVWIAPGGWRALLGAVVLAAVVVCGYALLTKVFPNPLEATNVDAWARLQEPYGYWNAIGLTAAMGAIGCLWLGARRAGHALLNALAYPAMGLMIVTLMLAYSRGALAALAIGVAAWMCLVPLRLRGARVLIVGALGAAPVIAWDFASHELSSDGVALAARTTAGHQLGVLLAAMLIVLALVGIAICFFGDRRAPSASTRRAVGIALGALLALVVVALAGGLAASKRGLTGTVSHDLSALTDPNAAIPRNTPERLTAIGSVRARYWSEALDIFNAHPALGAGAGGYETARLRYRTQPLDVRQAHGYIVQTLADLGIAGLVLTLALLIAWMGAAGRSTHPFNRRWMARPPDTEDERRAGRRWVGGLGTLGWRNAPLAYTPERIGMLTMLCVVLTFGVHSFADWTWYVPGDAFVALLCAGWLAGRGSLPAGNLAFPAGTQAAAVHAWSPDATDTQADGSIPTGRTSDRSAQPRSDAPSAAAGNPSRAWWRRPSARELGPARMGVAIAVLAAALLAAWTEWQPQRSAGASEQAVALLARNPVAALGAAQAGVERDPLSTQALFTLAAVQRASGERAGARETLQKAVQMQPSNPQTWLTIGEYDMTSNPRAAVQELRAAVYLNPLSIPIQNAYVRALQAAPPASARTHTTRPIRGTGRPIRGTGAQNRLRRPLASRTRRAPGSPPAPATATSSKPKSAKRAASSRRV